MTALRRLISRLAAVLVTLALAVLVFEVPVAAASICDDPVAAASAPCVMTDMGANDPASHSAGKSGPVKGLDCLTDCPLLCGPIAAVGPRLDAPVRPYVRHRYVTRLAAHDGRSTDPQDPPPRTLQV